MAELKPKTVYALVLTFEEDGKLSQNVTLWSLKGNATALQRAFVSEIKRSESSRLVATSLEKMGVVPVLADDGFRLAAHTVAATWEGDDGVEQTIEVFQSGEDAETARADQEKVVGDGSDSRRLVALTCEKTVITAPVSEGDATFRSYQDAVYQLKSGD